MLVDALPGFRQIWHDLELRVECHQGIVRVVGDPEALIPRWSHTVQLKAAGMDVGGKCHTQRPAALRGARLAFVARHGDAPRQGPRPLPPVVPVSNVRHFIGSSLLSAGVIVCASCRTLPNKKGIHKIPPREDAPMAPCTVGMGVSRSVSFRLGSATATVRRREILGTGYNSPVSHPMSTPQGNASTSAGLLTSFCCLRTIASPISGQCPVGTRRAAATPESRQGVAKSCLRPVSLQRRFSVLDRITSLLVRLLGPPVLAADTTFRGVSAGILHEFQLNSSSCSGGRSCSSLSAPSSPRCNTTHGSPAYWTGYRHCWSEYSWNTQPSLPPSLSSASAPGPSVSSLIDSSSSSAGGAASRRRLRPRRSAMPRRLLLGGGLADSSRSRLAALTVATACAGGVH